MMLRTCGTTGSRAVLVMLLALTSGCHNAPLKYETIWDSAQYGAVADIDTHLRHGVAVNARDQQGRTPLMVAAGAGQLQAVRALLKRGAGVSVTDAGGQTAAFKAAAGGHLEVVQYLIDSGAELQARDAQGQTLLHIAARRADTDLMALLVSRGADMAEVASVTQDADAAPPAEPMPPPASPDAPVPERSPATSPATSSATATSPPPAPASPDRARPATTAPGPAPSQPRPRRRADTGRTPPNDAAALQAACTSNLKQLCLAFLMYAQDYDQVSPLPGNISEAIHPYCRNDALWHCPAWKPDRPGYALSRTVPGKQLAQFPKPAGQFSFFEANLGKKPLLGGAGDLARPPRHRGGNVFGFMDGHCKWYLAKEEPAEGWK